MSFKNFQNYLQQFTTSYEPFPKSSNFQIKFDKTLLELLKDDIGQVDTKSKCKPCRNNIYLNSTKS